MKAKQKPTAGLDARPKPNTPENKTKGEVQAWIRSEKDPAVERAKARLSLSAPAAAALASSSYLRPFGEPDLPALIHTLEASMNRAHSGDLKDAESMLVGQAHALQAIFMRLADRAGRIESMKQCELDMRLALKAQAQCCRTLEVLAAIKNPPIVLARQANITSGPQQINNGLPAAATPPACEQAKVVKNELFEGAHHEQRMVP